VSVIYQPGGGTAPPNRGLILLGIGVEVAVVEGGYALLAAEGLEGLESGDPPATRRGPPVSG